MNLSECLNAADIRTLRMIADNYDLPCSRHSKLSLLQEILFSFRNPTFLREQLRTWFRGRERGLLRLSMDHRNTFSREEVHSLLGSESEFGPETVLCQGWLYPMTDRGGRTVYGVPSDLHEEMRKHVVSQVQRQISVDPEGPLVYEDAEYALSRDLDVFLEYVHHHEVKLTVDGRMYKQNLTQLLELLEISEEPLEAGWRFGYGRRFHDYPNRLALLYDFSFHRQWIDETSTHLITSDRRTEWLDMNRFKRQEALLRFYLSSYRRAIPRLPQILQLVGRVTGEWVHSTSMATALGELVNAYYYDDREQVWNQRILRMLTHLGVVRIGADDNGDEWFQITELGQQLVTPDALPPETEAMADRLKILIVQPNFEVVVTADQPLVTLELSGMAEIRSSGPLRIYRITEESVAHGIANGLSVATWLHFLGQHAQTPIPGNVERTLQEWGKKHVSNESDALSS